MQANFTAMVVVVVVVVDLAVQVEEALALVATGPVATDLTIKKTILHQLPLNHL